jgi:hypothetical protein
MHPMAPDIEAESMGWTLLKPGMYLHVSDANAAEVLVVGDRSWGRRCWWCHRLEELS